MIYGDTKLQIAAIVPPDRYQINEAILRYIAFGGEILKLEPAPADRELDVSDGSGLHLEKCVLNWKWNWSDRDSAPP